ncbi:hypothetical protein [Mycobacterium aquaticum]|uniref:Uncharacterized protein n=1 Tax=Mycobacterium aquaticum TaxID=1927124 RepID=A0A1W9ZXU4_9MYCO|nr:hypothetical protein [Mycobacterium aquaticum]ORA22589.1 hypothetical protein BST13_36050 [Mycobacterium aquaticum]
MAESPRLHADGTECLDGARRVPKTYQPCCDAFDRRTASCVNDIRFEWWPSSRHWVVIVPDGGSSGLHLSFCPFCGFGLAGGRP